MFVGNTGHFDKVLRSQLICLRFHVDTMLRCAQDWFEENLGSEVVFLFCFSRSLPLTSSSSASQTLSNIG